VKIRPQFHTQQPYKSILGAGGYAKVAADAGIASAALKGRMMDAMRAALAKVALAEV
jgi:hypothetical protein